MNSDLLSCPFAIPETLTLDLGYDTFHWPLTDSHIGPLSGVKVFHPRRFVALWWEPLRLPHAGRSRMFSGPAEGDKLRLFDGQVQMYARDPQPYIDFVMYTEEVEMWIDKNGITIGDSYHEPTQWLIVDRETHQGYMAPIDVARLVIVAQSLDVASGEAREAA